jgi:hypothetical protein
LPFVQCQVTRHGRKVWYFRHNRTEPRVRLPDLYGSDEFTAIYRACLAGKPMIIRNQRQAPKTKFKGLIDLYLKSSEWQCLQADNAQNARPYLRKMGSARLRHGRHNQIRHH